MAKNKEQVSAVRRARHGGILSALFAVISILWISPMLVVLLNSFKRKAFIWGLAYKLVHHYQVGSMLAGRQVGRQT